jgi:zinc transporter, ZIP family
MDPFLLVIFLCFFGPVAGSLLGVLFRPAEKYMLYMLSFAAGTMLALSFMKLIPESVGMSSVLFCVGGIVLGTLVMYIFDKIIPHIHPALCSSEQGSNLEKTSVHLFFGLFLHNFPEGLAMGVGFVSGMDVSVAIALAIAIHDIPEALCTSAPYYYVSKKRLESFLISCSTAIPTVAGFIFSFYLYHWIPIEIVGLMVGVTAGLMIYISSDELIPTACGLAKDHGSIFSLMAGVISVVLMSGF